MMPLIATKAAVVLITGWLAVSGAQVTYHAGKGGTVVSEIVKQGVNKIRIIDGDKKPPKKKASAPPKTTRDHLATWFGSWVYWLGDKWAYDYGAQEWKPDSDPAIQQQEAEDRAWWKGLSPTEKRKYAEFITKRGHTVDETLKNLEREYR